VSKHAPERILATLKTNPGIHAGRLAKHVGLSWNGAAHHLRKLRAAGLVATLRVSNRRLYFLPEDDAYARVASVLTSAAARAIAHRICTDAGRNAREIANATQLSRRVVYHHTKRLRDIGLVTAEGEPLRFRPTALLVRLMRLS
jgi:predicted transcriptional regulator